MEVDPADGTRIHHVSTDVVRWHAEQVELQPSLGRVELENELAERTRQLLADSNGRQILVTWSLRDTDPWSQPRSDRLAAEIRAGDLARRVRDHLRSQFGVTVPGAWTVSVEADTSQSLGSNGGTSSLFPAARAFSP